MKTLGPKKNFLAIGREHSRLEDAAIAIVSAPYEHTVSYGGGTANGPAGILAASAFVEFYDDEFDRELCFEKGIATLEPIDFGKRTDGRALAMIQEEVGRLIDMGKFVVTLGGEHTIATAPIRAHLVGFPAMSVLHFDAHSDLRDSYEGSKYSHASFAARVAETLDPARITQVGIRAQCREEAEFIRERGVKTFYANAIRRGVHGAYWQQSVVDTLGEEVYITFDVDYFDPAIMPSTGTPEPDGFLYSETLDLIRTLIRSGRRIIGLDVVELAPVEGVAHPDLLAARLVYKLLNCAFAEMLPSYPRLDALAQGSEARRSTSAPAAALKPGRRTLATHAGKAKSVASGRKKGGANGAKDGGGTPGA
ncbi:MAG TPA: agmatinase [Candidatus Kapabacteria bacterium]|nr:agmatinase [Candidatus Kapabacteria bacterium]